MIETLVAILAGSFVIALILLVWITIIALLIAAVKQLRKAGP